MKGQPQRIRTIIGDFITTGYFIVADLEKSLTKEEVAFQYTVYATLPSEGNVSLIKIEFECTMGKHRVVIFEIEISHERSGKDVCKAIFQFGKKKLESAWFSPEVFRNQEMAKFVGNYLMETTVLKTDKQSKDFLNGLYEIIRGD